MMSKLPYEVKQKESNVHYPYSQSPLSSLQSPYYLSNNNEEETTPSSSFSRISPLLILVIIILAAIFFIAGLVHLLIRFLFKRPISSSIYLSNRYHYREAPIPRSHALQRQLQQLFRFHDTGLDQSLIDALPVFYYKDLMMGSKEPFDCAVCLSEFSEEDKLRLLPMCNHAFHIDCIDTWLLSNSTCPLCRGNLLNSGFPMENQNPRINIHNSWVMSSRFMGDEEDVFPEGNRAVIGEDNMGERRRVCSVRLGKFRNSGVESGGETSSSSSNLDGRRCYSMGAFQYVVGDSNLQVVLSNDVRRDCLPGIPEIRDGVGNEIGGRIEGESFSMSKIWLWSKKNTSHVSSSSTIIGL